MKHRSHALIALLLAALFLASCGSTRTETDTAGQNEAANNGDAGVVTTASDAQSDGVSIRVDDAQTAADAAPDVYEAIDPAAEAALKSALDPVSERYGATGVQAAFIRDGRLCACYAYGWADKEAGREVTRDTKFRCASLSKLTVAMTTVALADEGKLTLDEDIGNMLGYSVRNPAYPGIAITPRMLLTHTSSIVDSSAFSESRFAGSATPLSSLLSSGSAWAGRAPGTGYTYSNFGVATLAAAEEYLLGTRFDDLAKERLFTPLDMDAAYLASELRDTSLLAALYTGGSVSYSISKQLAEQRASALGQTHHLYQGNLTVSAADYAKLIVTLLNGGSFMGRQILSPKAAAEITGAQFDTGSGSDGVQGLGEYQLSHVIESRTMHCHTGSNFGMYACFAFDPSDKSGIVIFTSGAAASMAGSGIYDVHTEMTRAAYAAVLS